MVVSDPSWAYVKVPVDENAKVPFAGAVNWIACKASLSVSVSFVNSDVFDKVVCVTVPPSKTIRVSVTVTGGSFTAVIFTKKISWTVLHPLESSTEIVTVVVPLCSGIYCIVNVFVFKVMVAKDVSSLVNEKDSESPSASEKLGLKLIIVSAASSFTVISGKGVSIVGQSFIGFILIVTRTSVDVRLSLSL